MSDPAFHHSNRISKVINLQGKKGCFSSWLMKLSEEKNNISIPSPKFIYIYKDPFTCEVTWKTSRVKRGQLWEVTWQTQGLGHGYLWKVALQIQGLDMSICGWCYSVFHRTR